MMSGGLVRAAFAEAASGLVEQVRRSVVVVYSRHGHGSGIIWDAQGLIVTNHHVISHRRATVELPDGRRAEAHAVARDEENDLALLRLDRHDMSDTDLQAIRVGDSRRLRVGDLLLAVGHPHGVRGTATLGIVSALGQEAWTSRGRRELLQADIDLAPGSSGGPLTDMEGAVVGIASMVMGPGMALAIPSAVVRRFVCSATAAAREPASA